MEHYFFALLSRMKYIDRWALMRNTSKENLSQHSCEVAMIAHALAVIGKKRFNKDYNPERAALLALYHDSAEIFTGDLPTPVKYFSPEIKNAYLSVESAAISNLLRALPNDLRAEYENILSPEKEDSSLLPLVKVADRLSALIKCIEERKAGNIEFEKAEAATREKLMQSDLPEVSVFIEEFLGGFELTLDQLN